MKAISLWQPWASLIVIGAKKVETRHWQPPTSTIGTRIAIHAAKTRDHLALLEEHPFVRYLDRDRCPLGCIVGTAILDRAVEMTFENIDALAEKRAEELLLGHYEPGRWAWVMRDPQPLLKAVPFRGRQAFFDVPEDLIGAAA